MANMEGMEGILSAFDVPLPDRCASMDVFERFLQVGDIPLTVVPVHAQLGDMPACA
jgi:hypothetical protein